SRPPAHAVNESPAASAASSARQKPQPPGQAVKRLDEFTPTATQRFPPGSREIKDTSELRPGMEVWVRAGRPWHRCTVTQVEDELLARVKLPATVRGPSERAIPAVFIRVAGDAGAQRARP